MFWSLSVESKYVPLFFSSSFSPLGFSSLLYAMDFSDYKSGFGGKFGVQTERQDPSAVGFDYKEKLAKHESQQGRVSCCNSHPVQPLLTQAEVAHFDRLACATENPRPNLFFPLTFRPSRYPAELSKLQPTFLEVQLESVIWQCH